MSSKCAQCGKTVFFSEKQSYDGKDFHPLCIQAFKKSQKPGLLGIYKGDEDRVVGQLKTKGGSGNGFCANCGVKKEATGEFCPNCGTKY